MSNADKKTTEPFGPKSLNSEAASSITYLAPTRDMVAHLPAGYPLRKADFIRRKEHLLVYAPNAPEILVPRFFTNGGQATVRTGDGVEVSRHMVLLMSNLSHRVEKALNVLAKPNSE